MNDYTDKPDFELPPPATIREAEKMIEDGVPFEAICKVLNISPDQLQFLGQRGHAGFK